MITPALFIGIAAALLRGGNFRSLSEARLAKMELIFVSLVIQFGPGWLERFGLVKVGAWGPVVHVLSYVPLYIALLANLRLPGVALIAIGTVLNVIPIAVNGGLMPVSATAASAAGLSHLLPTLAPGQSYSHALLTAQTHLPFLGDVIPLTWPHFLANVISIGDIVLALGVIVLMQPLMGARRFRPS